MEKINYKKMNKKGILPFLIAGVVVLVLVIIALALGVLFYGKVNQSVQDALSSIGSTKILIIIALIFVFIFRDVVKAFLMTIIGWIK